MKKNIIVTLVITFILTILSCIFFIPINPQYWCENICPPVKYITIFKLMKPNIFTEEYWGYGIYYGLIIIRFIWHLTTTIGIVYIMSQIKKVGLKIFIISLVLTIILLTLLMNNYLVGMSLLIIILLLTIVNIILLIILKIKSKKQNTLKERTDKNERKNRRN